MFDPSDRFRTDPFVHYHAAVRASEESAMRAQAEGRKTAQRQQRIRDAAARRAGLTRPDPRYKPIFPGASQAGTSTLN
jgi:hypothetical protein